MNLHNFKVYLQVCGQKKNVETLYNSYYSYYYCFSFLFSFYQLKLLSISEKRMKVKSQNQYYGSFLTLQP